MRRRISPGHLRSAMKKRSILPLVCCMIFGRHRIRSLSLEWTGRRLPIFKGIAFELMAGDRRVQHILQYVSYRAYEMMALEREVVCAKFAYTTRHGAIAGKTQTQEVGLYNLEVVISVGYRVKSIQGTRFRQWLHLY